LEWRPKQPNSHFHFEDIYIRMYIYVYIYIYIYSANTCPARPYGKVHSPCSALLEGHFQPEFHVNHRRRHFLLSKASELASCVLQLEMMRVRFKLWSNSAAMRQLRSDQEGLPYRAAGVEGRKGPYDDVMNTVTLRLGSRAITCAQAANCSGSLAMSAR
jgi:hypothetical protein